MSLDAVTSALEAMRCRFTEERGLQDAIEQTLRTAGFEFTREASLTPRDRVDFLVGDVAVEVKVDGSRAAVTRQLHRYADCAAVKAVVLVTTKALHCGMPDTMVGKPVRVVYLLWRAF